MPDITHVIIVELEIDSLDDDDRLRLRPGEILRSNSSDGPIEIELSDTEAGHGFGISEIITVTVSFGTGVSSDLVAEAIRSGVKKIIHRSKAGSSRSDGSRAGLTRLIERERRKEVSGQSAEENGT